VYSDVEGWKNEALLAKWARIREVRDAVNKDIEAVRSSGQLGSSLQAWITITAPQDVVDLLASLGDDLKFVTITSQAHIQVGESLSVSVQTASAKKCERCWHYRDDVDHDAAHPGLCGRCTSNLFGVGEERKVA
ncbi:MAG: zinc finger domain-containing protein, partial [Burkholderiales bacterium]